MCKTLRESLEATGSDQSVSQVRLEAYASSDPFNTNTGQDLDVFDRLERLKQLQADGVLTEKEYNEQKQKLLSRI